MAAVFPHDVIVGESIVFAVALANEYAVVAFTYRYCALVKGNHVCPDLIYVGRVGKVDHIRSETTAGTHVDFEGYDIAFFAQTFLIF